MGLNINNSNNSLSIIRMNGRYCAIIFIVHYIICLNVFIYDDYFYNKSPYHREGLRGVSPIDISDYHKYGPNFRRCCFFFLYSYESALDVFINFIVDIIAYVRMQRRSLSLKQFLKTDIFVWLLDFFIYILIPLAMMPYRYYVIPVLILNPITMFFLILFRLRQYQKYGIIKNNINLYKITEFLSIKQLKLLNFASRFRRTE